jgi:ABC-type Mn2+/Zn2+ transport system ATPase subunit
MMALMFELTSASRKQLVKTDAKERNSKQLCHAPIEDLSGGAEQ